MASTEKQVLDPLNGEINNEPHAAQITILDPLGGFIDEDDTLGTTPPGGAGARRVVVVVSS